MKNTISPLAPGNGQFQVETLHEAIAAFERKLQNKAAFLDGKRCSTDNHVHWKARGSQETLWEVARYLRAERRLYRSSYALQTALRAYLEILQTSQEDAEYDKARLPRPRHAMPIAQWKAEGEALVLSKLCPELESILDEYATVDDTLPTIVLTKNQPALVAS